jgi:hypothetical protein
MNLQAAKLCRDIEVASSRIGNGLPEANAYKNIQDHLNVPSLSSLAPPKKLDNTTDKGKKAGLATALAIGVDYWSKSQTDSDYYFTSLSALSPGSEQHGDDLYYFCFPGYKVAVPIRSGDVILFNPLVTHCCSNPRYRGSYIFSCYVSKKTVLTQAANELDAHQSHQSVN